MIFMIPAKGCAFQRECRCALGITDSVVIAHSVVGCAHGVARMYMQSRMENARLLSTGIYEEDLVRGGEKKLRAALTYARDNYQPAAILVVTGCTPQIMNDDVAGVISEFRAGIPVLPISVAGFHKQDHHVPTQVLKAAVKYMRPGVRRANSVNLVGLFPDDYQMKNDLSAIRDLLGDDISINAVYAYDIFQSLCAIPEAALNVVWPGFEADGELLYQQFNIPYVVVNYPYGVEGTTRFLRTIFSALGLSAEERIQDWEKMICAALSPFHTYIGHLLGVPCAVIGNQNFGFSFKTMLEEELGMCVKFFDTARYQDFGKIETQLTASPIAMLFGDSFVRGIAERLGIPLFRYCYPVTDRIICGRKTYAGYAGFLNLLEDMINLALEYDREDV